MDFSELKEFLDTKATQYNHPDFITTDPIQIPHRFTKKEDIEISSLLVATIAWGNRKSIIKNGFKMMEIMDHTPYDFIMNHTESDLDKVDGFVHRTFNSEDLKTFFKGLQHIYKNHDGLENIFTSHQDQDSLQNAISKFKSIFFEIPLPQRTQKHISDPIKGSAAKRINMFLRWMVRNDNNGVDFGIWTNIPTSKLSCPLDVHTGNIARKLGLLNRKQNDQKALIELDKSLRKLDPQDPVKYDFALFGLGAFEAF
jgi:uncharacterized protein (TIGR02757 family)